VPGIEIDADPTRNGGLVIRTSGPNAARGRLVLTRRARIVGRFGRRTIRTRAGAGPPRT
jgi:hypothetical protein